MVVPHKHSHGAIKFNFSVGMNTFIKIFSDEYILRLYVKITHKYYLYK